MLLTPRKSKSLSGSAYRSMEKLLKTPERVWCSVYSVGRRVYGSPARGSTSTSRALISLAVKQNAVSSGGDAAGRSLGAGRFVRSIFEQRAARALPDGEDVASGG